MTVVWRRGTRATHKKILNFTKEYGEEDAFLPRKCKGDKFPRLTEKLKSDPVCIVRNRGKNHDACLASWYKTYP